MTTSGRYSSRSSSATEPATGGTAAGSSKACRLCGEVKPLSDYYAERLAPDGHRARCKPCVIAAVNTNRRLKADYYRDAERARGLRRRQAKQEWLARDILDECLELSWLDLQGRLGWAAQGCE